MQNQENLISLPHYLKGIGKLVRVDCIAVLTVAVA